MKALTIKQPWASLLMMGAKPFETRSWATSFRGHILIHAGKTPPEKTMSELPPETVRIITDIIGDASILPTGCILGMADMTACTPCDDWLRASLTPEHLALGDYSDGQFAWRMTPLLVLAAPIQCSGKQGLWDYTP